jgi:hypothetical protein
MQVLAEIKKNLNYPFRLSAIWAKAKRKSIFNRDLAQVA